jgi:broad specificity phosphatase PhoE
MTELWLVRHGQTDWNLNGIYQGQQDIPLNETGIAQARALAEQLRGTRFATIYSSDLQRARQTAQLLAEVLQVPVRTDPRLREIKQGVWEGKTIDYVRETYHPDFSPNPKFLTTPRAEGAESLAEVIRRMIDAANEYFARHNGERILLSTHGLSSAALYCVVQEIPLIEVGHYIPENGQPLICNLNAPLPMPDILSRQS